MKTQLFFLGLVAACLAFAGCPAPVHNDEPGQTSTLETLDSTFFEHADNLLARRRALPYPEIARFAMFGGAPDSALAVLRRLLWDHPPRASETLRFEQVSRLRCFESPDSLYLFRLAHDACPLLQEVACTTWLFFDPKGQWVQQIEAEELRFLYWKKPSADSTDAETLILAVRRTPDGTELLMPTAHSVFNVLDPMAEQRPRLFDAAADPCAFDPALLHLELKDCNADGWPDLHCWGDKVCGTKRQATAFRFVYLPQKRFFVAQ